jgi:hypothetical protein
LIWAFLVSCSSSRNIPNASGLNSPEEPVKVVERTIENNLTNRDFFISKGKISTSGEGNVISLYFTMKYKLPDIYLISLRSKTGIEAFRIFINQDTVLVNDRINKTVLYGNTYDFARIAGIPLELLKVSFGDSFYGGPKMKWEGNCTNEEIIVNDYLLGMIIKTTILCRIAKAKSAMLSTGGPQEFINIEYKKHRDDINRVPKIVEIQDFKREIKIKISILKVETPWYGNIDFVPGSGYKIKPLI